ncbi:hypothetical protein E0W68_03650 [Flavobacterium salilacus subsp. salilacus]|uniref:hypothetical protein n=1 Tax=Flavobacterium TaxID=237 RepID=UPI001074AC36|nr:MULTISPECIES: hypothetical protein [Flavobacterium]KAF2519453.1 hypothetical protein E0W68_03650 [Flavobacterium salilacus subsp. salilacus]MBE1614651.1 hypothetical protein [Flavobacterium sp. SaA2.13]
MTNNFYKTALFFGLSMFIMNGVIFPLLDGKEMTIQKLALGLLIWGGLSGFTFAYIVHRKPKKKN